ncbi:MAG: stalk domain-containing protein [Lachnospirales bacterium]
MKKRLALALAGVMALSTLPMNVFAGSTNSVSGKVNITSDANLLYDDQAKPGEAFDEPTTKGAVYTYGSKALNFNPFEFSNSEAKATIDSYLNSPTLTVNPTSTLRENTSFTLYLRYATWAINNDLLGFGINAEENIDNGKTDDVYAQLMAAVNSNNLVYAGDPAAAAAKDDGKYIVGGENTTYTEEPDFTVEFSNTNETQLFVHIKKEMEQELKGSDWDFDFPIIAYGTNDDDDYIVGVDGETSSVTDGEYVFGTQLQGATTATVNGADTSRYGTKFDLTVTENATGTFEGDEVIKFYLPNGFEYSSIGDNVDTNDGGNIVTLKKGSEGTLVVPEQIKYDNTKTAPVAKYEVSDNGRILTLKFEDLKGTESGLAAFVLRDLYVVGTNDKYGRDITMDITGNNNVTSINDIVIGRYEDYGIIFKTVKEEVPTLYNGRLAFYPISGYGDGEKVTEKSRIDYDKNGMIDERDKVVDTNNDNVVDDYLYATSTGLLRGDKIVIADDGDAFDADKVKEIDTDGMSTYEDYHKTATIHFAEQVGDSWWSERETKFKVPAGMKIVGFKMENVENIRYRGQDLEAIVEGNNAIYKGADDDDIYYYAGNIDEEANSWGYFEDDYQTFVLANLSTPSERSYYSDQSTYYENYADTNRYGQFDITFYVAAEAEVAGDVMVELGGSAINCDPLDPVKVAVMETPFEVETEVTNVEIGYQKYNTANIQVKETENGRFNADEEIYLQIDTKSTAGDGDDDTSIPLKSAEFEVVAGDMEITDDATSGRGQYGYVKVYEASSKDDPSTIKVYDVSFGIDRTVAETNDEPFDVQVTTDHKDNAIGSVSDNIRFGDYDRDYMNIATSGQGTENTVEVAVTVGDANVLINGKTTEMTYSNGQSAESYNDNGSIMVPVRFVSEAFGYDVQWSSVGEVVTIFKDAEGSVQFPVNKTYYVDSFGKQIPNHNDAKTVNVVDPSTGAGTVYVPFRTVGLALGVPSDRIVWDADTQTGYYNYNAETKTETKTEEKTDDTTTEKDAE